MQRMKFTTGASPAGSPLPPPTGFIPVGVNVERERPANLPLNFLHYRDKPGRINRKPKPVDANGDANGLRLFFVSFTVRVAVRVDRAVAPEQLHCPTVV